MKYVYETFESFSAKINSAITCKPILKSKRKKIEKPFSEQNQVWCIMQTGHLEAIV